MNDSRRKSTNALGIWWWNVDRTIFGCVAFLMVLGAVAVFASGPWVARRIGADQFHFIERQALFLMISMVLVIVFSLLNEVTIKAVAIYGFAGSIVLMLLALAFGPETNGAKRWIALGGFSLQPSEFVKPFLFVLSAALLSARYEQGRAKGFINALALFMLTIGILAMQPDMGMTVTVISVMMAQFFMAGLPLYFFFALLVIAMIGMYAAYELLPHFEKRINIFLSPEKGDTYQVDKSLEAFQNGGFFGVGPGEGVVKKVLPDSHTDFVFAVLGEEFGAITCMLVIALFAFIVIKVLYKVSQEKDWFTMLALTGIVTEIGVHAVINIGVSLHLLPTKGMTLPFISYGGSSSMGFAIAVGMLLALTRKKHGYIGRYGNERYGFA